MEQRGRVQAATPQARRSAPCNALILKHSLVHELHCRPLQHAAGHHLFSAGFPVHHRPCLLLLFSQQSLMPLLTPSRLLLCILLTLRGVLRWTES